MINVLMLLELSCQFFCGNFEESMLLSRLEVFFKTCFSNIKKMKFSFSRRICSGTTFNDILVTASCSLNHLIYIRSPLAI